MTHLRTGLICLSLSLLAGGTAEANRTRTRTNRTATTARTTARTTAASTRGLRKVSSMKISSAVLQGAKLRSAQMTSTVKNNATPGMSVFPTNSKITWTQTRSGNYKNNTTPAFTVSKLDKSGKIDMLMLIPTSGHTGLANAQKWAVQSKYNIRITHADGSVQNLGKVQSVDLVTQHGMSINLQKGMTKVQIWADGSAGVGGFKAGREMEINWSGN